MGVSSIELADALSHSARHLAVAGVTRTMSSLAMGCHSAAVSSQRVALRGSSLRPTRGASRPSKIVGTVVSVPRRRGTNNASPRRRVVAAADKGYGNRYGTSYGYAYGYAYGDPEFGGLSGRPSGAPSSPAPASGGEAGKSGLKAWWARASKIDRSTIAALGGAALLSYGLISNLFYVSSLLGAMYTAVKVHAASPLVDKAAMQTFVTTYFGLWMIQNFLRPARMGLSVAISPFTDKLVEFFRQYVPGNRKPLAFALTVFCVNVLGTFAYMFGGFFLINALTGVPLELDSLKSLLAAGKAEIAKQGLAK